MAMVKAAFDVHRIHESAFGTPVEASGRTVIPVARVVGLGGWFHLGLFGSGSIGLLRARPLGLYDVDPGGARWRPPHRGRVGRSGTVLGLLAAVAAGFLVGRRTRAARSEGQGDVPAESVDPA